MFTPNVLKSIDNSVLCWLSTASLNGEPNVSPKEVFTTRGKETLLIANIASPQSARNIAENPKVCVAFVDVLVQKGFQVFGEAQIIKKSAAEFAELGRPLREITQERYPFGSIIKINAMKIKPIIAPSYRLYPDTTEEAQVAAAMKAYRFQSDDHSG